MADFEQIYRDYFRDVFLYLRQLSGGNEQLAEDITIEVKGENEQEVGNKIVAFLDGLNE